MAHLSQTYPNYAARPTILHYAQEYILYIIFINYLYLTRNKVQRNTDAYRTFYEPIEAAVSFSYINENVRSIQFNVPKSRN